jgi:hypothetical protein
MEFPVLINTGLKAGEHANRTTKPFQRLARAHVARKAVEMAEVIIGDGDRAKAGVNYSPASDCKAGTVAEH